LLVRSKHVHNWLILRYIRKYGNISYILLHMQFPLAMPQNLRQKGLYACQTSAIFFFGTRADDHQGFCSGDSNASQNSHSPPPYPLPPNPSALIREHLTGVDPVPTDDLVKLIRGKNRVPDFTDTKLEEAIDEAQQQGLRKTRGVMRGAMLLWFGRINSHDRAHRLNEVTR
jgi:hypothetical protein